MASYQHFHRVASRPSDRCALSCHECATCASARVAVERTIHARHRQSLTGDRCRRSVAPVPSAFPARAINYLITTGIRRQTRPKVRTRRSDSTSGRCSCVQIAALSTSHCLADRVARADRRRIPRSWSCTDTPIPVCRHVLESARRHKRLAVNSGMRWSHHPPETRQKRSACPNAYFGPP